MASENLTAEEQAAMDADKAAEIEHPPEDAPAGPAPETGGAEGTAPEGQDPPQRQGMVPHAALHEERTKRQDTERQLAESRKAQQTLEERTNLILQRFAAPQQQQQQPPQNQPQAQEIPAFDQDPAGHILAQQRQQQAIINELVQAVVGQGRQSEAASAVQQLDTRAAALEQEFAAAHPDYHKASEHLFEMRRQDLIEVGWKDPVEIQRMMSSEARSLAAQAIQQGRNPAELIYNLAKRHGFTEPAAPAAPANGEDQLRTIDAGQQQSRSVGNMRGAGPAPLTAQRLAEMSEADFMKMMDTPEGKALMGA